MAGNDGPFVVPWQMKTTEDPDRRRSRRVERVLAVRARAGGKGGFVALGRTIDASERGVGIVLLSMDRRPALSTRVELIFDDVVTPSTQSVRAWGVVRHVDPSPLEVAGGLVRIGIELDAPVASFPVGG